MYVTHFTHGAYLLTTTSARLNIKAIGEALFSIANHIAEALFLTVFNHQAAILDFISAIFVMGSP